MAMDTFSFGPPMRERDHALTGEVRLRLTWEATGFFDRRPVYVLQVKETLNLHNILGGGAEGDARPTERWRDVCDRDLTVSGLVVYLRGEDKPSPPPPPPDERGTS